MAKKNFNFNEEQKESIVTPAVVKRDPAEIKARKLENLKEGITEDLKEFSLNREELSSDLKQLTGEIRFFTRVDKFSWLAIGQRLIKIRDDKIYPDEVKTFDAWIELAELGFGTRMAYHYIGIAETFGNKVLSLEGSFEVSKLTELYPLARKNPELIPELLEMSQQHSMREIREYVKQKKSNDPTADNFVKSPSQTKEEEKIEKIYWLAHSLMKKGYEKEKMNKILSVLNEINHA